MLLKDHLRKKYFKIRRDNYFDVSKFFFKPIDNLLKKVLRKNKIKVSLYYPSNYEVNTLQFFELTRFKKNIITLLPSISANSKIKFYKWDYLDNLNVNKYGMLEPSKSKKSLIPNIILVPLLAFDNHKHRLGYGKGYYDRFLNKYLNINNKIITIGVAFSFQKYNKLPTSKFDVKLDYILTENGIK